jgi:hypothetical protein
MDNTKEPAGEGPAYHDRLPLRWHTLEQLPSGPEAERLAEANARVLTAVALLEEHSQLPDEPSATELELHRIHHKLNLLLELIGSFLQQQAPRPETTALRLSWRGLSWTAGGATPAPGEVGLVELHLSPALPLPLRWPARIVSAAAGEVGAEFAPVPEFCQMALERHVFKHHRRRVAETRQPARSQP